jgi:hypothetical protein
MNTKAFKRLIKEAVIDAIHEELPFILEEHMVKQEKKALRENRTMNFNSSDVMPGNANVRTSLRAKMGEAFGFQQPQPKLEVIDAIDEATGERVNPFAAFIADSAANMTAQDISGLRNLG